MTDDQSKSQPDKKSPQPDPNEVSVSVHLIGFAATLRDVVQRLSSVEEKIEVNRNLPLRTNSIFVDLCKVVFGGWPALGFLFLLLFYSPLRDALNAIPDKVKSAQEIGVLGVSLKSTIKNEAAKLGETSLSETIPRLSGDALEFLLRAPHKRENLVSYTPNRKDRDMYDEIHFPGPSMVAAMSELEDQGLVDIGNFEEASRSFSGKEFREKIDEFRKTHPGRFDGETEGQRVSWKLNTPTLGTLSITRFNWQLTDFGKKAVSIILKAISAELKSNR